MKKIILILIIFQLVAYSQFSGGSGTELDPYHVATAEDLDNIRNYLESSFIQTADIDLGVAPWNLGEGWEPIGDYDWTDPSKSFRGDFDGDGFEISNMYINNPADSYVGVFGSSDGVYFQNMNVMNFDITSGIFIGGIVGISYNDSISNCITQGFIGGDDYLGLLTGFFEGYKIKDCHVQGEINSFRGKTGGFIGDCCADSIKNCSSTIEIYSNGLQTGGFIGFCNDTKYIENCYSICNINTAGKYTGGFIGDFFQFLQNTIIKSCFSKGNIISSNDYVGGLIGFIGLEPALDNDLKISDCFSIVEISGNDIVGGGVGRITEETSIENCYSSGSVTGNSNVGGFVGLIDSLNTVSISNSYWDTDTSGLYTTAGNLGEGRTTSEMTDPYAGNTYIDWDFADTWVEDTELHNNGYPFLGWHDTSINDSDELLVMSYELEQNYPNPFNNQTNIEYTLKGNGKIDISVFNSSGQFVRNLINGVVNAGMHSTTFNADNLNSGIYYYQLKIDGMVKETKKMLYLR